MKLLYTFFLMPSFFLTFSQAPEGINYQAIVRNSAGAPIDTHLVSFLVRIHQGDSAGTVVYQDTEMVSTNQFGLVSFAIGANNPAAFAAIDWTAGPYFNEIKMDPTGGFNFVSMGTTQLMSVPYALYANEAKERQTLSISGNKLSITSGNSVTLPSNSSTSNPAFEQTLVIGNKAGINNNDGTQGFIGATQEPGATWFLMTAAETVAPAIADSGSGTWTTEQNQEAGFTGCGGGNGTYVYGATTYKGTGYYTIGDGCGTHFRTFLDGSDVTFTNGSYPSAGNGLLFSDGKNLYIHAGGSNWSKLQMTTANTAEIVGTLTLPNTSSVTTSVMSDGTYYYALQGSALYKYEVNAQDSVTNSWHKTVYLSGGLVNIDANRLYILSATTAPGQPNPIGMAVMRPIEKP